jgi:hypothetical protein
LSSLFWLLFVMKKRTVTEKHGVKKEIRHKTWVWAAFVHPHS